MRPPAPGLHPPFRALPPAILLVVCATWTRCGPRPGQGSKPSPETGLAPTAADDTDPAPDSDGDTDTDTDTDTDAPPGLRFAGGVPPQNLLMISIDTLRADAIDRLGGTGRMPFLSSLADSGYAVDDARACSSWTLPTTACALAGRSSVDLAEQTGVMPQVGWGADLGRYPEGTSFLADWLGDAGFYGILVTANAVLGPVGGQARGYDVVHADHGAAGTDVVGFGMAELAQARLDGRIAKEQPWFLHLHLYEPHKLYTPPDPYLADVAALDPIPYDLTDVDDHNQAAMDVVAGVLDPSLETLVKDHFTARYHAELTYLDDILSDAWAAFDAAGLLDDSLVVFWSDHGEQLWGHGLLEHGLMLHDEENRALLFFWGADLVPGATDRPASVVDMAPTLLDVFGLVVPEEVTGVPLHQLPVARSREAVSVGYLGPIVSAHRSPWLIHWALADPAHTPVGLLPAYAGRTAFDLSTDPDAQTPTWDDQDPVLQALWKDTRAEALRAEPFVEALGFKVLWLP